MNPEEMSIEELEYLVSVLEELILVKRAEEVIEQAQVHTAYAARMIH